MQLDSLAFSIPNQLTLKPRLQNFDVLKIRHYIRPILSNKISIKHNEIGTFPNLDAPAHLTQSCSSSSILSQHLKNKVCS